MRIYEIIVILDYKNFDYIKDFILFFKYIIIYNNFIILNIENWGILNFRYKIRNESKGFFLLLRFYMDVSFLKKFLNYLKFNEFIIRFFLVHLKKNNYFISSFCLKKVFKKKFFKKNVLKKKRKRARKKRKKRKEKKEKKKKKIS